MATTAPSTPLIMAHRGGGGEAPENSWASLEHTAALGLDHMETDAHATADGVVVLHHDPTLDRTTDSHGPISSFTWDELAKVRDASGGGLVRLDAALERFPDMKFNVDAKSDAVVEPLTRIAAAHSDRILVASFSSPRLSYVREHAPHVRTSLGRNEVAQLRALSVTPGGRALASRITAFSQASAVQIPMRAYGVTLANRSLVSFSHDLGLDVHLWDADSPQVWKYATEIGIDGIITDLPAKLKRWLDFVERGNSSL